MTSYGVERVPHRRREAPAATTSRTPQKAAQIATALEMAVATVEISLLRTQSHRSVERERLQLGDNASVAGAAQVAGSGPKLPVASQACEGPKIVWQVIGTAEFPSLA